MVESPKFDVFLAHNSKDKPQVRAIAEELRKRGLKPWLDEEQMLGGDTALEEIQKGISLSKSVAFFIGLDGSGNWQGNLELPITVNLVLYSGLRLIPVLLPGVQEIPKAPQYFFLSTKIWISFESIDDAKALNRLEKSIRKQILSPSLPVFEFDVVTVDVQSRLFGLQSKVTLNRSHSQARYFTENLGNDITLDMVAIPGGKFLMGTEDEEIERLVQKFNREWFRREKPQHKVTVQPFFMGKFPVTQAQWRAIASLPKVERDLEPDPSTFKGDNRPVESVSWDDAVEFCARLSKQTVQEYRLPSEAEWEYACRAGTTTPFHFGETITTGLANYNGDYTYANEPKGEYRQQTTSVGSFPPNAFGLYDMHGNVWERCEDNWHDNYKGAPDDGSAWLSGAGNRKVVRGGSWLSYPDVCRSAFRLIGSRDIRDVDIGFRVVCVAPSTT